MAGSVGREIEKLAAWLSRPPAPNHWREGSVGRKIENGVVGNLVSTHPIRFIEGFRRAPGARECFRES